MLRVLVLGHDGPLAGDTAVFDLAHGSRIEHDFALRLPSFAITGRVAFTDNTPAARAKVQASWNKLVFQTESDQRGEFRLEVPDVHGSYLVEASLAHSSAARAVTGPAAGLLLLVLPPTGRLQYRYVDAATRRPLPGSEFDLRVTPSGLASFWLTPSPDAQGWCEERLPCELLDLSVCRKSRARVGTYWCEERRVRITPDEPTRVEFHMRKGCLLRLVLADGNSLPPEDQHLLLVEGSLAESVAWDPRRECWTSAHPGWNPEERLVRFDGSGNALVHGLSPGEFRWKTVDNRITLEPEPIEVSQREGPSVSVRWRWR